MLGKTHLRWKNMCLSESVWGVIGKKGILGCPAGGWSLKAMNICSNLTNNSEGA